MDEIPDVSSPPLSKFTPLLFLPPISPSSDAASIARYVIIVNEITLLYEVI
jgi:hypothetical protein